MCPRSALLAFAALTFVCYVLFWNLTCIDEHISVEPISELAIQFTNNDGGMQVWVEGNRTLNIKYYMNLYKAGSLDRLLLTLTRENETEIFNLVDGLSASIVGERLLVTLAFAKWMT